MKKIIEIGGWFGVIFIFGAYVLNSFGIIDAQSILYVSMNIVGSFGIVIDALYAKNYQPAVLNILWIIVAFINLIRIIFV